MPCPSAVGFPSEELPHTDIHSVHLLPQTIFTCDGSLQTVSFYSTAKDKTFIIGIARWTDKLKQKGKLIEMLTIQTTKAGAETVDIKQSAISVQAGDFLVVLADEEAPSPLTYSAPNDVYHGGAELDLTVANGNISVTDMSVGDDFDITEPGWYYTEKTFSLSFTMESAYDAANSGMLIYINVGVSIKVGSGKDRV